MVLSFSLSLPILSLLLSVSVSLSPHTFPVSLSFTHTEFTPAVILDSIILSAANSYMAYVSLVTMSQMHKPEGKESSRARRTRRFQTQGPKHWLKFFFAYYCVSIRQGWDIPVPQRNTEAREELYGTGCLLPSLRASLGSNSCHQAYVGGKHLYLLICPASPAQQLLFLAGLL